MAWSPFDAPLAPRAFSPFAPAHLLEEGASTPAPTGSKGMFPPGYPEPPKDAWGSPPFCRPGSEPSADGGCEPTFLCPSGFNRSHQTGFCDPQNEEEFCGPDFFYDKTEGVCRQKECPKYYVFDQAKQRCKYAFAGGPCCAGQVWNEPHAWKTCGPTDKVWSEDGTCTGSADIPLCRDLYGPLSRWDAQKGTCICPEGYQLLTGKERGCKRVGTTGPDPTKPPPGTETPAPDAAPNTSWRWGVAAVVAGAVATWFAWPVLSSAGEG